MSQARVGNGLGTEKFEEGNRQKQMGTAYRVTTLLQQTVYGLSVLNDKTALPYPNLSRPVNFPPQTPYPRQTGETSPTRIQSYRALSRLPGKMEPFQPTVGGADGDEDLVATTWAWIVQILWGAPARRHLPVKWWNGVSLRSSPRYGCLPFARRHGTLWFVLGRLLHRSTIR